MTAIEAAVNWWADKLYFCKQSGLSPEERLDPSNKSYQLGEMLMTLNKPSVTEEQVERFKTSLTDLITSQKPRCISVDYDADIILHTALVDAQIRVTIGTLPIKTTMWLDENSVSVRYGYGAQVEVIYPIGE